MKDNYQERSFFIKLLFLIAAVLLLVKVAQIQIFDTSYEKRAIATAVDNYTLYPSRGLLYDRNEKLLINNNPMYDLRVTYNQLSPKMDTMKMCSLLKINKEQFKTRINKNFRDVRYSKRIPFVFESKISSKTSAKITRKSA